MAETMKEFIERLLAKGWWYIGDVSRVQTMADGSPRVQIDANEDMIDTEGFNNFATVQKNKLRIIMLVVPLTEGFAEELIEELKAAENGRNKRVF